MDRAVFVALSGAVIQEQRLQVLTENLANINTPGFKKQDVIFEDAMAEAGGLRVFAVARQTVTNMSQGFNKRTERSLDVALEGKGFFEVETPFGTRYTRNGTFMIGKGGALSTSEGYSVIGRGGVINLTGAEVVIDAEGNVSDGGLIVGRLRIVDFENPSLLKREGNYYSVPGPWVKEAADPDSTQVVQGYLEVANVNAVRAMTAMIEASRSYETHAKMIQTIDDMTRKSIEDVGRN